MLKGMYGQEVAVLVGSCHGPAFEKKRGTVVAEYMQSVMIGGALVKMLEVRLEPEETPEGYVRHPTIVVPAHRASGAWRTMQHPDKVLLWKQHLVKAAPYRMMVDVEVLWRGQKLWADLRFHERNGMEGPLVVAELDAGYGEDLEVLDFQVLKRTES